ncbi:MAG: MBL fold metallo-hydrolase [Cyclobacteriaceae bacterium]|nr:MAG: MBL fold metallo-hydrolase [Cyclobacteriaceae bacterium]
MNVGVRFLGAARTVTGSKYLLDIDGYKLLIDCGLFQGVKKLRQRNWQDFPAHPDDIDAVLITHSHIDHIGYLPRIFKQGYQGPIFCTEVTADLMRIMLMDSAKIQEEEAAFARKKGYSRHANPEPLYGVEHVEVLFSSLNPVPTNDWVTLQPNIKVRFINAGHILGSSIIEIEITGSKGTRRVVFSGDLGRYDQPVLRNPEKVEKADVLFVESTYGDRNNPSISPKESLASIINEAYNRQGCIIIPAFALGRTQLVVFYLKQLLEEQKIPEISVYIDSPMAISVTDLYKKHFEAHKLRESELEESVFDYRGLQYCKTAGESKRINEIQKNAIIVSASGMCTGGRIIHHLYHRLRRENDTILFVGYQALGTRGRRILDKEPTIRMFGQDVPVRCSVRQISGLSAHADQSELMRWLGNFSEIPEHTFITHGEPESANALAALLKKQRNWHSVVPDYLEWHQLFDTF